MNKFLKSITSILVVLLTLLVSSNADAEVRENYYTILLNKQESLESVLKDIELNKGELIYSVPEIGLLQIKATDQQINKISKNALIDTFNKSIKLSSAEENPIPIDTPISSTMWEKQWDMHKITHNGESYKLFSGTKNVTVGIIDSGLDINHPDLKNNIVLGSKNLVPKGGYRGEESAETGAIDQLTDFMGHGTHVAGQIAANGTVKGVAPGIGIKSYRVLGNKKGESIWVTKAIVEAAKDNVDVINISLGEYLVDGTIYSSEEKSKKESAEIKAYKKAIQLAKRSGSVVVAATGNDSLEVTDKNKMSTFFYEQLSKVGLSNIHFKGRLLDVPAELPDVVTVSSTGPSDEISLSANYGKGFVDITAPGGDSRLLKKYGWQEYFEKGYNEQEKILSTYPNGEHALLSGTSMAAPKVSGTIALIIDKYNMKKQPNKAINFLYNYGVDQTKENKNLYGNGMLDVYNAVRK
ncbi:S8 family peptidase [Bacillus toyonensis]|uniref:S8 family peptidase n=1 Tax=Bacillus toyonensis TaxID=155322 RepID=UPI002175DE74|nr:S8 family serine peptidase [Bacillus toyonensis]